MEINNNARKSSASEIQNIPNHQSGLHLNHALFRRTRAGAGAAGATEGAGADSEMEEERHQD